MVTFSLDRLVWGELLSFRQMFYLDWIWFVIWMGFFPIPFFWLLVHPLVKFWRRVRGRTYAAFGAAVWLSFGCFFVLTRDFWVQDQFPRSWLTYLGGAVLLAVEVVMIPRAESELGLPILVGWAERDPEQFPPRLVDMGIYRYLRHPRYVSAMSVLVGAAVLSGATRLLILAALSFPLYYAVTLVEERELARRLGPAFLEYQRRVPRFLPRFPR